MKDPSPGLSRIEKPKFWPPGGTADEIGPYTVVPDRSILKVMLLDTD